MQDTKITTRRAFISRCANASLMGAAYTLGINKPANAITVAPRTKTIRCFNIHTRETVIAKFYKDGAYNRAALQQLNFLLRDHRENKSTEMDIKLYEQLWQLQLASGNNTELEIISGYRTLKTNNHLRKKSNGVAVKSYHMRGQAIDLRITNFSTKKLFELALALNAGGVGYYPKSSFIHVDTGPVRHWAQ